MLSDLRFGARMLWKQPVFTVIGILTLALGIGATAAVFSLVEGVLLTPPPYPNPQQLVLIPAARAGGQQIDHSPGWSGTQLMAWQKEAKSFESIAAYDWTFNFLVLSDGSESMEGMYVTRDYFQVTGLQPFLGRSFSVADTAKGATPVILLGYEFWQRKFNADRKVLGSTIRMSRMDRPFTVIGVMPPGVRFLPSPGASQEPNYNVNALVDFWIAASSDPAELKTQTWNVAGRLRHGVTPSQAQAELRLIAARQAQSEHDSEGIVPQVQPLTVEMNRDGRGILLPLLGASILVLLIACGNAAALLLVRGLQRQQEYAVRSALGIGRIALFRQVSTESLLLALLGGAFGVALAFGIIAVLKAIGGYAIPRLDSVHMGWPVLAFGLGMAILSAGLAGLLPALRATQLDPVNILKSGGSKSSAGIGERSLLPVVTTVQTAFTLALLVGAGLLIQTMMNLSKVRSGYNTEHILTMSVTAVQGNWDDFHTRALARVAAIPGVERAAFAWGVPLTGNNWPGDVQIEGQPAPTKASEHILVPLRSVTPGYFDLLGLAITQGRDIRSTDNKKAPQIALVNQALADRYFPNANPIGKKIWFQGPKNPPNEIVGVVANARNDSITKPTEPEIYFSMWQVGPFSKSLVVRTAADPRAITASVLRELHLVDPTVAVENVKTLEQIRGDSLASRTFAMQLLVGFSIVGSILTLIGIYGVLSLSVTSRRREIAIRTAVGARQQDIRKLVFSEGFRMIGAGIAAGIGIAVILSRVLKTFLFGIEPTDPLTLAGVAALFAAVALLACWEPTRRAAKVEPSEALRYE